MTDNPFILHLITPSSHASPFDINMAYDAGFQAVVPYGGVGLADVAPLVQDMIFSRGPSGVKRTSLFIGGRDIELALDMMEAAKKAMVPPFSISILADPSGAFTTAAALVATTLSALSRKNETLQGKTVAVLGGTGPVGLCAAVLSANAGAKVILMSYTSLDSAKKATEILQARFAVNVQPAYRPDEDALATQLRDAQVVFGTARAGVRVMSASARDKLKNLQVAADLNAVPPSGIEGVGLVDAGVPLSGSGVVGIGPLAVGNVKYKVEQNLLQALLSSAKPAAFDFRDAFAMACKLS